MGSDELFAGHSRYSVVEQQMGYFRKIAQSSKNWMEKILIPFFNVIYKPIAYQLTRDSRTEPWQSDYLTQNAVFNEKEISRAAPKLGWIFDPEVFLHKFHHLDRVKPMVASYLYFDVKTRLADCYLLQLEKFTAAHALNWKVPFLDKNIEEFLAGLPEPEYLEESEIGSYLKAIVKDVFPESFIARTKRTRKTLLKTWIESPELKELFQLLLKGTLVDTGLISKIWIMSKINELGKSQSAFQHLWSILILEIWFRIFVNRPILSTPPTATVEELLRWS